MLEKTAMKEAYLLSDTHNYREDCCGLRRGRPVTNTGMPLHIFQSIFINRQSATMFYSPRECLMHNYSLSKQIYTLDFFFFSRALMQLTGSLSVWLAECRVLSLCKVFWCSLDAGLAHWAANGLGSMTRDGGGCSEGPFVFSLCCYFGLFVTELIDTELHMETDLKSQAPFLTSGDAAVSNQWNKKTTIIYRLCFLEGKLLLDLQLSVVFPLVRAANCC